MLVNHAVGEVGLKLGPFDLLLRPSHAAIVSIEKELGAAWPLLNRHAAGGLTLRDRQIIIEAGIRGAGGTPPATLGEIMVREGYAAPLLHAITRFLENIVGGEVVWKRVATEEEHENPPTPASEPTGAG